MSGTLVSTGERITNDNLDICFVQGAYNLGPIYESREIITTAMHAGEIVTHVRTVGGEDNWLIMPDKSPFAYGVLEWDPGLTAGVSSDYSTGDDVKAIVYHLNPGAVCRNVQCVDPDTVDCQPDHQLHTNSGTAGALKVLTEVALVDTNGTGTGEAFNPAALIGDLAATIANRTPMKQAYFLTDPSNPYVTVAYILNT